MRKDKILQFVRFETKLDREPFIRQWELFNRSKDCDLDVNLQQYQKTDAFIYIAQHRCRTIEQPFAFTRAKKPSLTPEPEIKTKCAGGYSMLQAERINELHANEIKVFAFLTNPRADLDMYRKLSSKAKLNIYEAYFENCVYAYILEFFIPTQFAPSLQESLKQLGANETGMYTPCDLKAA